MRQLQIAEAVRAKSWRMSWGCKWSVVGSRARRVMRKGWRWRGGGHGRARARLFRHSVRIRVVIFVRMRPRHGLRRVGILRESWEAMVVGVVATGDVMSAGVRLVVGSLLEP